MQACFYFCPVPVFQFPYCPANTVFYLFADSRVIFKFFGNAFQACPCVCIIGKLLQCFTKCIIFSCFCLQTVFQNINLLIFTRPMHKLLIKLYALLRSFINFIPVFSLFQLKFFCGINGKSHFLSRIGKQGQRRRNKLYLLPEQRTNTVCAMSSRSLCCHS